MAKLQRQLKGDFQTILDQLDQEILGSSISATLEDASDFNTEHCRCAVRVYERYSLAGANRLSMSITLLQDGDQIHISAITAGGSNGIFFKVNTMGEDAFLARIAHLVEAYGVNDAR